MPATPPTWLRQMPEGAGAVLLRNYPGDRVQIACAVCGRSGTYALARLVERLGDRAGLPDVLDRLASDCPRRQAGRVSDPCRACFPDLVPKRPG